MKKFVLLAVTALVGLAAVSCKEKEIEPEDALSIAGSTITVGVDAANPAITFTANKAWTATSDVDWIVPSQTSGEAGTITLTLAVSENTTWEERRGKVTVAVGALETVFTIVQGTESIFGSVVSFNISSEAQELSIPVITNMEYTVSVPEDCSWITVVSTKAEPTAGAIKIQVAANTELAPRTGTFTIEAPGYMQSYIVIQDANWIPTYDAEAIYIANSQFIYDNESGRINLHQQFVVKLASEAGDQVTLVLNKKGALNEAGDKFEFAAFDKVPVGTFEVDATGKKEDNTFSIQSSTGEEKYFTSLVSEDGNIPIFDGEIVVEEADGQYTVTAILVDAGGYQHSYSYVGALALTNDFRGGNAEVNWKNTYNTHFTTKANEWFVSFYLPRKNPADMTEVAYASFSFYSAAGEVNLEDLPEGTYSFAVPESDADLKYKSGVAKANPGVLSSASILFYDAVGGTKNTEVTKESTVLTISKNADGTKNFKYNATVKAYSYDENWNVVYDNPVDVSIDVDVPLTKATDTQNHPYDDKDDEFLTLEGAAGQQYVGYWYGKNIGTVDDDGVTPKEAIPGTKCNIFSIGSNSYFNGVWSMFISIVADENWMFEKNFSNRFCNTPVPDGTYTFGTEAQIGALLPLKLSSANRCYVQNTYTGTTYYPVSGTVVLKSGTITVDLVCKATEASLVGRPDSPESIHVTGGTPFTCYYIQDYSGISRVKNLKIESPVPVE